MKASFHNWPSHNPLANVVCALGAVGILFLAVGVGQAQTKPPEFFGTLLDSWSFADTNWLTDWGYAPLAFTNISNISGGNGNALQVDTTDGSPAFLLHNVIENDGTTNLTVDQGSVTFWFSPDWSGTNQGGPGPGEWGRLLEVGSYTTNASCGWWSLYTDHEGVNLYFSAQTNDGSQATYLSAPIAWTSNAWHNVTLTYSATNSALYLDGQLVTNGLGVAYWPGPDALTNGFSIGSSAADGLSQAHGLFDDLATYNYPLGPFEIAGNYAMYSIVYYDTNMTMFALDKIDPAPSAPSVIPTFDAVTGPGYLQPVSTNTSACVTSSSVWITNVICKLTNNGTMNVTFTIGGGADGLLYDVFANSALGPASNTNCQWAWMGQGCHCVSYVITNLPNTSVFLILGTPQDSDHDGLTDAYERLVSRTDPNNPDTAGDGISDADKVLMGVNPLTPIPAIPAVLNIQTCPQ